MLTPTAVRLPRLPWAGLAEVPARRGGGADERAVSVALAPHLTHPHHLPQHPKKVDVLHLVLRITQAPPDPASPRSSAICRLIQDMAGD